MQLRRTYEDRIYLQGFELPNRIYEKFSYLRENLLYRNFYDNYSLIVFQDRKYLS